jgi:hypothetical protein
VQHIGEECERELVPRPGAGQRLERGERFCRHPIGPDGLIEHKPLHSIRLLRRGEQRAMRTVRMSEQVNRRANRAHYVSDILGLVFEGVPVRGIRDTTSAACDGIDGEPLLQ